MATTWTAAAAVLATLTVGLNLWAFWLMRDVNRRLERLGRSARG